MVTDKDTVNWWVRGWSRASLGRVSLYRLWRRARAIHRRDVEILR